MSKSLILASLLSGAALLYSGAPLAAAADPTVTQVYEALQSNHVAQAEQMISQVLTDYPRSGKAHYVAAEVYARAGNYARARSELATAEQLTPGLPKENPSSVAELRSELNSARVPPPAFALSPVSRPHESGGLPWGLIILALLAIGVVWLIARRRAQMYRPAYMGNVPPPLPGQPGYGPGGPGMGPGPYYPGYPGGGGSGLMGSLGTGLAVGAGVAVGEELVHHVLDGNHPSSGIIGNANADELGAPPPANSDMGGQDFGVNDPGSWDDSSGGGFDSGGGGGDDWS